MNLSLKIALIIFSVILALITTKILALLLFLTMSLTIITSGQKKKITLLIQEISILKSEKSRK